jgi:hypothetical protein
MTGRPSYGFIVAAVLWTGVAHGLMRPPADKEALEDFESAVAAYMTLRESLTQALPPRELSPDADQVFVAVDAMAAAIQAARPAAKEGDIFDAEAAPLLRRRIRQTVREPGCEAGNLLARAHDPGSGLASLRPIVHDRFDWAAGSFMAGCLLDVLPALPEELQFRFVNRDLVLVDIDADLIIDVLPDALPPVESRPAIGHARLASAPR